MILKNNIGKIKIAHVSNSKNLNNIVSSWKNAKTINYTKYNIKESDMRTKTATFTSPDYIDLTTGQYNILISSKYHENFAGFILDVDYDKEDGLYNYQCQDWSRQYQSKFEDVQTGKISIYNLLMSYITHLQLPPKKKYTAKEKKKFKTILSGLRPLAYYNQKVYNGNKYNGNPFQNKGQWIIRDKSYIEAIRDIVYSQLGFFDVYFNDKGILQIEPLSKTDWEKTGLHLSKYNTTKQKYKFSTTNTITKVLINGEGVKKGKSFKLNQLKNQVDLSVFFGDISTSISNSQSKTKKSKNTSTTAKTGTNPYGNKDKKIWIGADGGSGSFCKEIVKLLEKNGWSCHYSGEGASVHNNDYNDVTKDYQILAIVDNGFCCTTVKEAYEGYCVNTLKNKDVTVMFMFDTRTWTNPRGMKPYRYGDFRGYTAHTAWDDSSGYCTSMKVDDFFRKHNAVYCAGDTAKLIVDQFLAGGYYKYKGK